MNSPKTGMALHVDRPALAKVDTTRSFEPCNIDEGYEMAKLLVASGLLPRGITRPEAAFAIIATGRELGLSAMQSLRSVYYADGKVTLAADLIAALCKRRVDICRYFRLVESTDKVARYETLRQGEPEPTVMAFTWEDATRAGLTGKQTYKSYPAAMLRARCITALARAVYPDLAMGLYDPDEIDAPQAPVNAGPAQVIRPVAKAEPPIHPDTSLEVFEALCGRVDASESPADLNAVAKDAVKSSKTLELSDDHLRLIKAAVVHKRGQLTKPAVEVATGPDFDGHYDRAEAEEAGIGGGS